MNDLRGPATDAEWSVYHDIRRRVLFELRGSAAYNANHPDEHRAGHYPLILWHRDQAVGVIRVDIAGDCATFRRVAVREDRQRRGHGRRMLALAEEFARGQGCNTVESHVDLDAVGFYERCGFARPAGEQPRGGPVFMTKSLAVPPRP